MKKTDRFLLAMVTGIVILVGVALTLALTGKDQSYLPDTTPGAVAHNYVLAIKQRDDLKAYSYLAPELKGYPATIDAFSADLDRYSWSFSREAATISVGDERIIDERAVVTISETRFYEGGLFGSHQYTTSFDMTLQRQGDAWTMVSADSYWAPCWSEDRPCQ